MQIYKVPHSTNSHWLHKILLWAQKAKYFSYFNPNAHEPLYGAFEHFLAVGQKALQANDHAFTQLQEMLDNKKSYLAGYLSYNLKKEVVGPQKENPLTIEAHLLEFFLPEILIFFKEDEVEIHAENPEQVLADIENTEIQPSIHAKIPELKTSTSKDEYIENCRKIKQDIIEGEYYELNYCVEFWAENCQIDPLEKYFMLNSLSPMPFSCLCKFDSNYVICASPERFLKREGSKLISQPIKGTIRRGANDSEDQKLKTQLCNSEKEIAENMMIVDLVRNDLSRSSKPGSVKVDEFFGVYSFEQVHQMISTISSEKSENIKNTEIIRHAFPMGSMTGAPKIRVMQAIEQLERSGRGIYSGAIGYFKPSGDFDFNVVIRSIIYDAKNKKLSFHVGSAITYDADPEYEYEECLLKANSMIKILSAD